MRTLWAAILVTTTSCSSLLAEQRPGPHCRETGAVTADRMTAVVSALVAVPLLLAGAECLSRDCGSDANLVYGSLAGVAFTAGVFTASAQYGARQNAECRRVRTAAWRGE